MATPASIESAIVYLVFMYYLPVAPKHREGSMPGLAGLAVNPQMGRVVSMPQAQCGERPERQGERLRLDTMPSSTGHHRYSHANASKMPAMRPSKMTMVT